MSPAEDMRSADQKQPLVSFLLVNYRTPDLTLACLESIHRHCRNPRYEVVVVDNASGDDSPARLRTGPAPITLVTSPVNLGFGGGCNLAARQARGRYLYLLNTDTELGEDSAAVLAEFLEKRPSAVAVGSRLIGPDGQTQASAAYFPSWLRLVAGREKMSTALQVRFPGLSERLTYFLPQTSLQEPRRVDWCVGASLMVRAAAYTRVGGFDENFFMYAEEVDLCRRLAGEGEIWFTPATTVLHLDGASSPAQLSDQRLRYIAAGHRLYFRKHLPRAKCWLYVATDYGCALIKGLVWRLLALGGQRQSRLAKAAWHWRYARNYFKISYPLSR